MALQSILNKITTLNYDRVSKKIVSALKDELKSSEREGYVFGLSGGLDSAVVASLLSQAASETTFALVMPSANITPKQDVNDATELAKRLNMKFGVIDVTDIHSNFLRGLPPNRLAIGNLIARIRMSMLYYYANQRNCLVAGTSDRSELLIGYFTKYGDGGADILPISSLYKTQVRALGKFLGLPDNMLSKKSAPMLWEKHTAESEIGMSYEELDPILYCMFDLKLSVRNTAKKLQVPLEKVEDIKQRNIKSVHKRSPPKICKF